MQIGQFWRLLDFMWFLIMRFYYQKDSHSMIRNLWKEQDEEKKRLAYFGLRTPDHVQRTIDRGINLSIALYDALFLSSLLVSKPHTKSSSALDYMNIV